MLFPTHLVAAALVGTRTRLPVVWLVVGAALPDVVDEPLATLGVVDPFHSVGHSALVFVLLVPAVRYGPRAIAVLVGWGSHLLLDALHIVINGRPMDTLFLFWPATAPPDSLGLPPGEFSLHYLWSPSFFLEVVIWAAFLAIVATAWSRWRSAVS